jgi:hypothetical protein
MKPESEGGEDRDAVGSRFARQRLVEMFEAALGGDPMAGKERELSRTMHERLERIEAVVGGDLPNRVHSRVDVERREALGAIAELGETLADLVPHWPKLFASH